MGEREGEDLQLIRPVGNVSFAHTETRPTAD
jgi:hypothetical protein